MINAKQARKNMKIIKQEDFMKDVYNGIERSSFNGDDQHVIKVSTIDHYDIDNDGIGKLEAALHKDEFRLSGNEIGDIVVRW